MNCDTAITWGDLALFMLVSWGAILAIRFVWWLVEQYRS